MRPPHYLGLCQCECDLPDIWDICCWGSFPYHEGRGRRTGLLLSLVHLHLLPLGFLLLRELQAGVTISVNFTLLHENRGPAEHGWGGVLSSSSVCLPPSAEPCSPPAVTSPAVTMQRMPTLSTAQEQKYFADVTRQPKLSILVTKPCPI